jgi:hypothetical protein
MLPCGGHPSELVDPTFGSLEPLPGSPPRTIASRIGYDALETFDFARAAAEQPPAPHLPMLAASPGAGTSLDDADSH